MQTLRELNAGDFGEWARHINRQNAESGQDGRPLFSPLISDTDFETSERRARFETSIVLPLSMAGWMRCWGMVADDGTIFGHLDLRASTIISEQHRVVLGIGLESAFYGQGLGCALMDIGIRFARENGLAWIDLQVLADNVPAIALYKKMGFRETGRQTDRFRINGRSVDDVMMALNLNANDDADALRTTSTPDAPDAPQPDPTPRSRRS